MTVDDLIALIKPITEKIVHRELDESLSAWLNQHYPADGELVQSLFKACLEGDKAGWICAQSHGGIRFGRIAQPSKELHGYSIDVVDMDSVVGPHHRHPHGEIDLILPLVGEALFDGHPAGWWVYPPDSAHRPTVSGGRAYVLYLLPQGAIEFIRNTK